MIYNEFVPLWVPRPENAFGSPTLPTYEFMFEHDLQIKMNGTCSIVYRTPDRKIITLMRDNVPHKQWSPTPAVMRQFIDVPGDGWYVWFVELMHNKVPTIKDVNYIRDIAVNNGEYLVGTKFRERQAILADMFLKGGEELTISHHVIDNHTWLARNYKPGDGYKNIFGQLTLPEHEGVVLINPDIEMAVCAKPTSNVAWLSKCRRPHKNYNQ